MTLCSSPGAEEPSGILPSPRGWGLPALNEALLTQPAPASGPRALNTSIEQGQLTCPFFGEMWVMAEHKKWIFMASGKKKK